MKGARNVETIVVDGGSTDGTVEIAKQTECCVLRSSPGWARQMNAGAKAASGDILLFLHADSRLPQNFDKDVRRVIEQPLMIAGAFRLRIDGPGRTLRLIEWGANLRARLLRMPYGDQGLFLNSETFDATGGFPDLPIMEDFVMVRRLQRRGRIAIIPSTLTTSARRWEAIGPWRTTWINQLVVAGYYFGVPPDRLACWYHIERHHSPR